MSGAKHTPGPWVAKQHPIFCIVRIETAHGLVIADVDASAGEDIANARLLAAAPELLEALNAMLTHMGMDEDEFNKPTYDQARAAIAKATGAAP